MSQKFFFIAGEASGDALGGGLIKALKERAPDMEMLGIGGSRMEEQGLNSLLPMEELCVMGLWEIVGQLPRLIKLINGVVEEIEKFDPDVVVTIDLPDFNFQVAKRLKKRGISKAKIIHYVAPTVWAWRPGRAKKIAQFLDGLICLFPFEPDYFTPHGLEAVYAGHPIVEQKFENADGMSFREKNGIGPQDRVLGVFPGSREAELKKMGPVFRDTLRIIREQYPDMQVVVPTLPRLEYHVLRAVHDWGPVIVVANDQYKNDAMAACDAALAVSGTVGLELAYMGVPHIIAYKAHPATWLAVRLLVKVKYAHLANIILNEPVVPEYLQRQCNAFDISKGVLKLIKSKENRTTQRQKFANLRAYLGAQADQRPSEKAAAFIQDICGS